MTEKTNSQQITDKLSFRRFFVILAFFLLGVLAVGFIISEVATSPYLAVMEGIGVLASISLSAILSYLYLKMSDIQDQQKNIMAQQREISEAEHLPHLFMESVSISSERPSAGLGKKISELQLGFEQGALGRYRDDVIEASLHNIGNGLAKDLRLQVVVTGRDETGTVKINAESIRTPVSKYDFHGGIPNNDEKQEQRREGNNQEDFLKSRESGHFWVRPRFLVSDGEETIEVHFSFFLELCSQSALFCRRLRMSSGALTGRFRHSNPEMDAVWRYGVAQTACLDVSKASQTAR